jgi:hypothetical protein
VGELADRLSALSVEARSPDGRISALARGTDDITVRFTGDAYRRYTESDLARQLEQLAVLTWTRYRRAHNSIIESFVDQDGPVSGDNEQDRVFYERLEHLTVVGASTDRWVTLQSRALVRWDVTVVDGAVRALTEEQFLGELGSAVADLMGDYQAQLIFMTDEIYDIGLPSSTRAPGAIVNGSTRT